MLHAQASKCFVQLAADASLFATPPPFAAFQWLFLALLQQGDELGVLFVDFELHHAMLHFEHVLIAWLAWRFATAPELTSCQHKDMKSLKGR